VEKFVRFVLPNGVTVEGPEDKLAPLMELYGSTKKTSGEQEKEYDDMSITEIVSALSPLVQALINKLS